MEYMIDTVRIANQLLKKFWVILIITCISFLCGYMYTINGFPNVYASQATVYSVSTGSYKESIGSLTSYAGIASSLKLCNAVAKTMNIPSLDGPSIQKMIKTSVEDTSAIMYISASSTNPTLTVQVANAVANEFVNEMNNITGNEPNSITGNNIVKVLDMANIVSLSTNGAHKTWEYRALFTAAGFLIACAVVVFSKLLSTKISSPADATLNGQIELLGVIPIHNI